MGLRRARRLRILMCRPDHFALEYSINPWMEAGLAIDRPRAQAQWQGLLDVYLTLGHQVELIDPVPGLPDMVFAANGGTIAGGRAMGVRFAHEQRHDEAAHFLEWLRGHGFPDAAAPQHVNEGQGDLLPWRGGLLGGHPIRTSAAAHTEVQSVLGVPVVSLELVDPRYYHLDTALMVLDDTVAFLVSAFSAAAVQTIRALFPDAIEAMDAEAAWFGLNGVCDGRHVILPDRAPVLAAALRDRGFEVIPVPFDEFGKSGGGPKCASLLLDWPGRGFGS